MTASMVENQFAREPGVPRVYAKQFAYKWRARIVTAFKKVMAEGAINHLSKLIRG